jgi:hypothetical protein
MNHKYIISFKPEQLSEEKKIELIKFLLKIYNERRISFHSNQVILLDALGKIRMTPLDGKIDLTTIERIVYFLAMSVWNALKDDNQSIFYITKILPNGVLGIKGKR